MKITEWFKKTAKGETMQSVPDVRAEEPPECKHDYKEIGRYYSEGRDLFDEQEHICGAIKKKCIKCGKEKKECVLDVRVPDDILSRGRIKAMLKEKGFIPELEYKLSQIPDAPTVDKE